MRSKSVLCILLFSFLICSFVIAGTSQAARDKVIIGFGDSITEGFWEITDHTQGARVGGYEPDLEALTDEINNHYDVLNYGIGGERTAVPHGISSGGYNRLKNSVLPAQPNAEYILIMEGTNDIWSGISRETTIYTLGLMIDKAITYGIIPILATLTPDTRAGISEFKNVPDYNNRITQLASDKNVVLADFYTPMITEWESKYSHSDLIHPSREGFEKIAEIWFEALALPIRLSPAPWMNLLLKN